MRLVENELSRMVLAGTVEPGDKVIVELDDGKLQFEIEAGGASELAATGAEAESPEPVESGRT